MRLMEVDGAGIGGLVSVCLHCGAESESRPPYEVKYCYCRSSPEGGALGLAGPALPAPRRAA